VQSSHPTLGEARRVEAFLPHLADLDIETVIDRGTYLHIEATTKACARACPACGWVSSRVHGRYRKLLQDLPVGGRPVLIGVTVRRLKCGNPDCQRRTFAEPLGELVRRHARNTSPLRRMLELLALALAARAGARLVGLLGILTCRDTLLRLIRALPDPPVGQVSVLGIDDWAKRKGHSYATLLINMETGQPIDILEDRNPDIVAQWMREHPEIQVICRDRAAGYGEVSRNGAPQATQVADRWHLWSNLCRAAENTVRAHRADLCFPPHDNAPDQGPASGTEDHEPAVRTPTATEASGTDTITAARTRERHTVISERVEQGMSITEIARQLQLDRKTVRKYRDATTADQLLHGRRTYRRPLDDIVPYLRQRVLDDGVANAAQLFAELQARGYRGSRRTVRRYLEPLRGHVDHPAPPPPPPTVGQATRWITSHPDHLTEDETTELNRLLARSTPLARLREHVKTFARMLKDRTGTTTLKPWLAGVYADDFPQLHSFVVMTT